MCFGVGSIPDFMDARTVVKLMGRGEAWDGSNGKRQSSVFKLIEFICWAQYRRIEMFSNGHHLTPHPLRSLILHSRQD